MKINNKELFVVTMHRWGDDESHNYVLGVFSSKILAEKSGGSGRDYRGNKYEPKITSAILDEYNNE